MSALPLYAQLINLFAAIILLLSFAMLAQRRVLSLIDLFALQGLTLAASTFVVAWARASRICTGRPASRSRSRSACCRGSSTG